MRVKIPIFNEELKRTTIHALPPKDNLFLGRTNATICSGPPPVASGIHVHAYGYQEPYGPIYRCGINGCNSPVELVIISKH